MHDLLYFSSFFEHWKQLINSTNAWKQFQQLGQLTTVSLLTTSWNNYFHNGCLVHIYTNIKQLYYSRKFWDYVNVVCFYSSRTMYRNLAFQQVCVYNLDDGEQMLKIGYVCLNIWKARCWSSLKRWWGRNRWFKRSC